MRAGISRSLVLLVLVACSDTKIAYLDPPPLESATSAIAAIDTGESAPRIIASTRATFELVLEEPETRRANVTVIGLEPSLAELGLVEGPVSNTNEGVGLATLPRTALVEAAFRDESWSGWARVESVPDALAAVRLPLVGCSTVEDRSVERFDRGSIVALAVPINEQEALLVIRERAVVWNVERGIQRSADLPIAFAGGSFDAAKGRAYLGSAVSASIYALELATLETTLFATTTEPSAGFLRWIKGDESFLMALSSTGRLFRSEGGANLELVASIDVAGNNTDTGGVLVLGRNEVLFGADNNADLHRFDGTERRVELEGPVDSKGFVALETVPMLGPVTVELRSGLIYARPSGQWMELGRAMDEARIIHPIAAGRFIVADGFGRWSEVHPMYPLGCGLNQNEHLVKAEAIFQLGRSVFAVGPGQGGLIEIVHIAEVN